MQHLDFKLFSKVVEAKFNELTTNPDYVLIRLNIDSDSLWQTYLNAYPKELNTIFREREHYNGNYDKNFVRRLGAVVAIDKKLNLHTIWDDETTGYFQVVSQAMKKFVLAHINNVAGLFATSEKIAGSLSNRDNYDPSIVWDHFYAKVPDKYIKDKYEIGTYLGNTASSYQTLHRAVTELSVGSVELVLELAMSGSIYRGEEFKALLKKFLTFQKSCKDLNEVQLVFKLWRQVKEDPTFSRFRNTAIGTLVVDINNGVELNKAVASYESKVAPTNYKRTKSVVTPRMIEEARLKLVELGYEDSIYRRFATQADISTENVLFTSHVDKAVDVFGELQQEAKAKVKKLDKVEEISITDFIEKVLPTAKGLEVLFEGKHKSNLVTLTAPKHSSASNLFKWSNSIAWAYNGDVTDAITERVKHFGGDVSAKMRISLSWHCADDLDLHLIEPDSNHIYFNNRGRVSRLGGMLDLDMNGLDKKDSENPVENIIYKNNVKDGAYRVYVNNYSKKSSKSNEFTLQVAFDNEVIANFSYPHDTRTGADVNCFTIHVKNGSIERIEVLNDKLLGYQLRGETVWGIKTGEFVPVSKFMLSPNYWNEEQVGNKHYIFVVEGCNSDEPQRGFFNEYLKEELQVHRKVFEMLGSKTKTEVTDNQVAGLGFSSTVRKELVVRVSGNAKRVFKVKF